MIIWAIAATDTGQPVAINDIHNERKNLLVNQYTANKLNDYMSRTAPCLFRAEFIIAIAKCTQLPLIPLSFNDTAWP